MASPTAAVFQIPNEVIEHALTYLHPLDVARFSQTCRLACTFVYGAADQYLWRQLFLASFDDPREAFDSRDANPEYNWKGELQRRAQAELIAFNIKQRLDEQTFALETFISMIWDALPVPVLEHKPSNSLEWVTRVLHDSRILDAPVMWPEAKDNQLISRIQTYLALTLNEVTDDKSKAHMDALRIRSRCRVYDLRNYRRETDYGPYLKGGAVNWAHAQAIVNVIQMNLREICFWMDTRPPVGLEATRAYSVTGAANRAPMDWACVEGTWRRFVCFMDYRDLFGVQFLCSRIASADGNISTAFNYSGHSHGSHNPSFFDDCNFQEATLLIELKLHLVPISSIPRHYVFIHPHKSSKSASFPNLYFSGTSNGIHGNEVTVNGSVHMGDDGVVRWRFASIYDGHSQWSSEGVQVGNIGSAAGIIGSWTGATHDYGDPVGPFWLWKVPDDHISHINTLIS